MSDIIKEAREALEGVTPGRVVQFHPSYCKEAEGAPFSEWDSSHDLSVIQPDGCRYRIGSMRHAHDAAFFQWAREGVPALIARAEAAEAALIRAKVGLVQARDELDQYSRQEYPLDHPTHERYRQRDYETNPARLALDALPVPTNLAKRVGVSHE